MGLSMTSEKVRANWPVKGGGLVLSVLGLTTRWLETALFTAMAVN